MSVTVDFIFDFGSPNAYLEHRTVPGIVRRMGATFRYVPCLLGGIFKATGNQPPMTAFGAIKGKLDYEMLENRRYIAKHEYGQDCPGDDAAWIRALFASRVSAVQAVLAATGVWPY